MAQVGHEAAGVVKITLHLSPFQGALLGEEGDALMIHGEVCCGPEPFAALPDDGGGILHVQELEYFVNLALGEVHLLLQFGKREAVGIFQRHQDLVHVSLVREGRSSEVLVDFLVFPAGKEHPVGMVDGAPGPPNLLVVGYDRTRRLVMDDEPEVRLIIAHTKG